MFCDCPMVARYVDRIRSFSQSKILVSMQRAVLIASTVTAVTALTAVTWLLHRWRRRNQQPAGTWQPLGTLREITLYPLRSGAALALPTAECVATGLRTSAGLHDRRLWLLNEEGKVASAGCYPSMLGISIGQVSDGTLRFEALGMEAPLTLDVAALLANGKVTLVKEQPDYRQPLVECGAECHVWFSQAVLQRERGLRLYVALEPIWPKLQLRGNSTFMPIMAMHDKSVVELNTRLAQPAHHQQFRGNLLIASEPDVLPYDEDHWQWLKIGSDDSEATILRFNSFCRRCIIVNIDVQHGKRSTNFEPLRTLRSYRLLGHPREPVMGAYFDVHKAGRMRQGDMVFVQRKV